MQWIAIVFLPFWAPDRRRWAGSAGIARDAPTRSSRRAFCSSGCDPVHGPIFANVVRHGGDALVVANWMTSAHAGRIDWGLRVDTLTAVMVVVVTTVSASCTSIRSATCTKTGIGPRFMAYLSLFTFAMLMLVTADNSCRCSSAGKASASPPTC